MANLYKLEGSLFWRTGLQLSVTREREFFSLPLHTHDFLEINYVAEGTGHHYIGDIRLDVKQKDIFIIPVGTSHVYRPNSAEPKDELIVYNCLIGPGTLDALASQYGIGVEIEALLGSTGAPYYQFSDQGGDTRRIMEGLHKEYMLRQPGYEAYLFAHAVQLLLTLHRLRMHEGAASFAYSRIGTIFDYIDAHFAEPLTLGQLAALLPVSPSHLQRLFKTATGQPFTEYMQNLRIEKSCDLLLKSGLGVQEVAAHVGYKDLKFFHALFKKKTGMSPNRYRKQATTATAIASVSTTTSISTSTAHTVKQQN